MNLQQKIKELEKKIEKFDWNVPYYNNRQRLIKQRGLKEQLSILKSYQKKIEELKEHISKIAGIDELKLRHILLKIDEILKW